MVGDVLEAGIVGGVGIEVIIEPAGVAVGALPPAVGVLLRVVLLVLVVPRPFPWGGARGEEGRGAREVQEGRRKQGVGEGGRGGNVDIEARVVVVVVVGGGGGGGGGGRVDKEEEEEEEEEEGEEGRRARTHSLGNKGEGNPAHGYPELLFDSRWITEVHG